MEDSSSTDNEKKNDFYYDIASILKTYRDQVLIFKKDEKSSLKSRDWNQNNSKIIEDIFFYFNTYN